MTVVDQLSEILQEVAEAGDLDEPLALLVNGFESPDHTSSDLFIRRGSTATRFASLPLDPQDDLQARSGAMIKQVQDLLNAGRAWEETGEIRTARDTLNALRQPLLDELQRHLLTVITFSDSCPFYQAQASQGASVASSLEP